jgi:hypothetical protein
MSEASLQRLLVAMKAQWDSMVEIAFNLKAKPPFDDAVQRAYEVTIASLAEASKVGPESIKRKLDAILYLSCLGHSAEEIKEMGQEAAVSRWNKSRKEKTYGQTVTLGWRLPGSQKALLEQQVARVRVLLKLRTTEEWIDWLLSVLMGLTDEQIVSSAGEPKR